MTVTTSPMPSIGLLDYLKGYWGGILYGFPLKGVLAAIVTFATDSLNLSAVVFYWYCAFTLIELVTSVLKSVALHQWDVKVFSYWIYRVVTQMLLVALVGGMFHMVADTMGWVIAGANWVLILCSIVDLGSIIDNLRLVGAPVPPFIDVLFKGIRRKGAVHLGNLLDDPAAAEALERSLAVNRHKRRRKKKEQNDA